jgi:uncharacterized HAD superfamily protein
LIIGVDLDGTVSRIGFWNPSLKLPWWLFVFLLPITMLMKPDKGAARKIKEMKSQGHKIMIVSARPPWMTALTSWWLRFHRVPFDEVFCVGFGKGTGKRKLEVIKKEGIEYFFDDSKRMVGFLNHNSVGAARL